MICHSWFCGSGKRDTLLVKSCWLHPWNHKNYAPSPPPCSQICSWYLSITSVQRSPWMTRAATLWDTQGCSPVLTQLWVHLGIRQWFPCGSGCAALPLLSALLPESKQLARRRAARMQSASTEEHSEIPHFSCECDSLTNTRSQWAMLSRDMNAWRVWSV